MADESDGVHRRRVLRNVGGLFAGSGLLGGCVGTGDSGGGAETIQPTSTKTEQATKTPTATSTQQSYTVSMVPVGEVEFDSVPDTWVANNGSWADMGIALGLKPPEGVWLTSRYHTQYYEAIPDLSVNKSEMVSLYQDGVSKELLYNLDGDIHVMDPNFLMNRFKGWDQSDVEEIRQQVGPFFGNCIFAQHYPWHSDYRYYTLYQAFEKLAKVFQRTERYEAFESVRDEFKSNLAPVVPGPSDRPEVAVLWGVGDEPEEFYPYIIGEGTSFKHFNDLNVRDALASSDVKDFHGSRAAIDLETLLEIDPEVLMLRGYETKTESEFQDSVVAFLRDHEVAGALSAVESGDVYRAGGLYQGPITNMVLTERTAKQLYGFDGDLFDRARVVEIVNGNV